MRTTKNQKAMLNKQLKNFFFNKKNKQETETVFNNNEEMKEYLEYYKTTTRWV